MFTNISPTAYIAPTTYPFVERKKEKEKGRERQRGWGSRGQREKRMKHLDSKPSYLLNI